MVKTIKLKDKSEEEKMKIINKNVKFLQHIRIKKKYYMNGDHYLFLKTVITEYGIKLYGVRIYSKDTKQTKQNICLHNAKYIYKFLHNAEEYYYPIVSTYLSSIDEITVYNDRYSAGGVRL